MLETAQIAVQCRGCGAELRAAGARTMKCPYCASPNVIERPPRADTPNPTFALAFALSREPALELAERWKRSRGIFTHSGIRRAAIEDMRGVYLPAFLYGAVAYAAYSAEIGENYEDTETYTTEENGRTVTHTRTVTRTEWRALSGAWSSFVRDIVVTASRGVANGELERVEPFDMRALRRYTPALLPGWICEEPSTTLADSIAWARKEAQAAVGRALQRFLPGDHQRGLRYNLRLENEAFDLLLVPVWVFAVRYTPDKPPVRLLVNGQTGKAWGRAPISAVKVTVAILLVLAVAGAILAYIAWSKP